MRILQVHKYLYRRAGAEAYVWDLANLLVEHGHTVGVWGTNANTEYRIQNAEYFDDLLVEYTRFDRREGFWKDLKKFDRMIWSAEAEKKFEQTLQVFKPEVVHIHNIYHHLSPSILPVAAYYRIPVVMTVHDYHLINPNYSLYDHGAICERQGLAAIAHRCIKNSYAATVADVVERGIHRALRVYEKNIAKFLAPTEFMKEKLVQGGVAERKIEVARLPVYVKLKIPNVKLGDYILFAGRLTEEKGIHLLLDIAKQWPEMQFKVAGVGAEIGNVECRIKNEKLKNVELLGFQEKPALQRIIARARIVIVPSLWYENSPYAVLEAMGAGKVVVASRIGGIPELIADGKTGFLVNISRTAPWVDTLKKVYYDAPLLKRVGQAAREAIRREHDPEMHYRRLMEIYKEVSVVV